MSRREKMMQLRFDERLTLAEIGQEFGISRERVRQIIGNTGYVLSEVLEERNEEIRSSISATPALAKKYGLSEGRVSVIRSGRNYHLIASGNRRKGEIAERYVNWALNKNGISNELMPTGHPFDILALDKVRIDVKGAFTASKTKDYASPLWRFHIGKNRRGKYCDMFICVIWDTKECFIIPDSVLKRDQGNIYFCWPTKRPTMGKYQKYLNRWDLITGATNDKKQSERISP